MRRTGVVNELTIAAVTELRANLWSHGFRPIPIINPDSGGESPGKRPLGQQWQTHARMDPPFCARSPAVLHALNTGLLTDGHRDIDFDIDDPDKAVKCRAIATRMLGPAPTRIRQGSPRALLVYRAAEGCPGKRTMTGSTHTTKYGCKIEVLGKGQQFVAFGRHASGADLEWYPAAPGAMPFDALTAVTEQQITAFLEACAPIIDATPPPRANGHDPDRNLSGDIQAAVSLIVSAVDAIPNHDPADWEAWNRVGMAIWAATGGGKEGWEAFDTWSATNDAYDAKATLERWNHYPSSPPHKIGAGTIFYMASKHGWVDPRRTPPPRGPDDYGKTAQPPDYPEDDPGYAPPPASPAASAQSVGGNWKSKWQISSSKTPLPNLFNVMITLRQHPQLCNLVQYDEMARSAVLINQIPNTPSDKAIPHIVGDADVLAIQEEIQRCGLRRAAKATVQDGVILRATQERFHPVKRYLEGLTWDGKPRVDIWLSYYLGAEPAESLDEPTKQRKRRYISRIGRLFLIAMIARIMQPGCKADYMLIFEGPQGVLKSSVCRILAGDDWFSDSLPDLSRSDAVRLSMHLRGKWLIEIAEMSSFNAAESHRLKEFLTQTTEQYTPKYGHNEVHEPRQCLFIGSTNEGTYLRDPTGGRRFWPVLLGTIDLEALQQDRDQLLAEAFQLYSAGEPWWPDREFEAEFMAPEQADRYEEDPWYELIEQWISTNARTKAGVNEILRDVICLPMGQFGTREQRRVIAILVRMRWVSTRIGNDRCYVPPTGARR